MANYFIFAMASHCYPSPMTTAEVLKAALKLHTLKQDLRYRRLRDADDVINLVLKNGINVEESRWRESSSGMAL